MSGVQPLFHPNPEDVPLERVLHALGDAVRLTILRTVAKAETVSCRGVCDVLPASTLSHQLRILREAGLVRSERCGKAVMNRLRREEVDARFPGLLDLVLREPAEPA